MADKILQQAAEHRTEALRRAPQHEEEEEQLALQRSLRRPIDLADGVRRLQRAYGNRYIAQAARIARASAGSFEADEQVEEGIQRARGGGQSLDSDVRRQMETAIGANFGNVRVHTGAHADALNRALSARAFTIGSDVFFREGEYSPASSTGRELLAHELTHVVQQGGGVRARLLVGGVDSEEEREADQVVSQVRQFAEPAADYQNHALAYELIGVPILATRYSKALSVQPATHRDRVSGQWTSASIELNAKHGQQGGIIDRQKRWVGTTGIPIVYRFSAGPHEQMTAQALHSGYKGRDMEDIQLGNWATDMNQISLVVPHLQRYLGYTLTPQEQFELVQLLAVGHFGEQAASRLSQSRLGEYHPSEHFDNPATANTPLEQRAVASHITSNLGQATLTGPSTPTGVNTIEYNLGLAIDAGMTSPGRQYYGRATHITQDFFAHTNFVRIAMRLLDSHQPEPYGGKVANGVDAGRYRLTSGIFDMADTVMSILHLLLAEIMKEPESGKITAGDRIILMLVRHKSPALGIAFESYLAARRAFAPAISRVASAVIPGLDIYHQARALVRHELEAVINRIMAQVGQRVTGTGIQPSHTRMNLDDPASGGGLYPIARALAEYVVSQLDPLMQAAWHAPTEEAREAARQKLFDRLRSLLVHPDQDAWWKPIVASYLRD